MLKHLHTVYANCWKGQPKTGTNHAWIGLTSLILPPSSSNSLGLDFKRTTDIIHEKDFTGTMVGDIGTTKLFRSVCSTLCSNPSSLTSPITTPLNFVIGGDHSIALPSAAATFLSLASIDSKLRDRCLLLWVDAHADINTVASSVSGNRHGMPVSFLVGLDSSTYYSNQEYDEKAGNLNLPQPYSQTLSKGEKPIVDPSQIVYIGLRDVDEAEKTFINDLNIRQYPMETVRDRGLTEILAEISKDFSHLDYVHCSFDVDAIDPTLIPSTGTPVSNGLTKEEATQIIDWLLPLGSISAADRKLLTFDLVELNPYLGSLDDSAKSIDNTLELAKYLIRRKASQ